VFHVKRARSRSGVAKNLRQTMRKVILFDSGRRYFYVQAQITQKKINVFSWQGCVHTLSTLYFYSAAFMSCRKRYKNPCWWID